MGVIWVLLLKRFLGFFFGDFDLVGIFILMEKKKG